MLGGEESSEEIKQEEEYDVKHMCKLWWGG